MGRFLTSVLRGLRAGFEGPDARRFAMVGKPIVCPHCGHDRFVKGQALLDSAGMSFLHLDWTGRSATTLACADCGRVEWFLEEPGEVTS